MNTSSRTKNLFGTARRHSWSHIIHVPLYYSDDEEKDIENDNGQPQRLSLTVRQPSFTSLPSGPSFSGKLVTKDGNTLADQNTVVFEPNFDRKTCQYPIVDVMKSLCNKSIYSDLSTANSANEENNTDNEKIQLSLSLTLPSFSSEESCTDIFTDPDDDFDQFNDSFQFDPKIYKDKNFKVMMDLRRINKEKWNNIGYIPPDII